jgi:indolepyruvate ferredoxin oxidoreductase, alpha subunit
MNNIDRRLLSGDEAVAMAARTAGVQLGTGYPGTPSTEILEYFSHLGGKAQWAPNEKVAMEVALGAAYAGARTLVTMKHVGLNVAADPLFTAAYTGTSGALVVISADDPGMASSQNEQDNRHYAVAAGIPMLEPADSQEAYDFTLESFRLAEKWHAVVLLRMTTRVCHSKTLVIPAGYLPLVRNPEFQRGIKARVMIPAYARPAHRRLRQKLEEIAEWNETSHLNQVIKGGSALGLVVSGVSSVHAQEAAPEASVLKVGMTYPLPVEKIRQFAEGVSRCLVIEEGDPYLFEALRAEGISVDGKPAVFRFGELNVNRIRRIIAGDISPEPAPLPGKPPQLCVGCPHRKAFESFRKLDCIVAGDIGCYTLGVLPPLEAMDTCVCMGASIGVGLGMRHVLPPDQARRVVSVIGDSTFLHSGLTGIVEMVYNRPPTGHVVVILDNSTTAMTGRQEHPGTGRSLDHSPSGQIQLEEAVRALGVDYVRVFDAIAESEQFEQVLKESLAEDRLSVLIPRRPCLLAAGKIKEYEKASARGESCQKQNPLPIT